MSQDKILPKDDPTFKPALTNYYGFTSDFWPISDGVIHLLGDGESGNPHHVLELVKNQDEAFEAKVSSFTQDIIWAEVVKVSLPGELGAKFIYREVDSTYAAAFSPEDDGFDAQDIYQPFTVNALDTYVRSFPAGTWRSYETDQIVDASEAKYLGYYAADDVWHGITGGFPPQGLSVLVDGNHYWNPYQGGIFFTRIGESGTYNVWAPFQVILTYQNDLQEDLGPRWGRKPTGSSGSIATPPWSLSDIQAHLDPLTYDPSGWVFSHAWASDPNVKSFTYEPIYEWIAARFVHLRVRHVTNPDFSLYTGTRGGFVNLTESISTVEVVKQYEDGEEEVEGTLATRVIDFATREAGGVVRVFYDDSSLSRIIPLHNGWWTDGILLNYVTMSQIHGVSYPPWSRVNTRIGLVPQITEAHLCAFLLRDAWALRAGWGIALFVYLESEEPEGVEELIDVFTDTYPLRVKASSGMETLADEYEAGECELPAAPDSSWEPLLGGVGGQPAGWVTLASQAFQYSALLSDDGDLHDPRANTANGTIEDFLALGDGLCYDGPLGSIPRPRSGATGTLLGREITGDADFAVDVMTLDEGHMAVMLKGDKVEAWVRVDDETTLVWSDSLEASIPPPVLTTLGENTTAAFDLRFLHHDWPTPTGVLTVGDYSLVVTPRGAAHRGYRWSTSDGQLVSPPFILHVGWGAEDRFPDVDPRSAPLYEFTGGPGGPGGSG